MKTEKLLEDLEVLIESSSRIPMTTKRMVEEDEIMRIIDSIQESLPLELEESRRIVADKDKVLADAQRQAETLIDQAKDYIAKLTAESELVKQAQEQALFNMLVMFLNMLKITWRKHWKACVKIVKV